MKVKGKEKLRPATASSLASGPDLSVRYSTKAREDARAFGQTTMEI